MRALIFANGDLAPGPAVERVLAHAGDALRIAADGGAKHIEALGYWPDVVIGDMDSLTEADLERYQSGGAELIRYPAAKDENDLELALLYAAERGADWIRLLAATGDRLDQTFANVLLLTLPALRGRDVRLVAGRQESWLLNPGEHALHGAVGDTLSLLPLGGDAGDVLTDGLVYPLRGETLRFGPARGISNVFAQEWAEVRFSSGLLLAVYTPGRA